MVMQGGNLNTSVLGPVIDWGVVNSPAAVGANVMDAQGKHWPANIFQHFILEIYEGPGSPQVRVIDSNSKSSLVVEGSWEIALAKGAKFRIFACDPKLSGEVAAIEAKLDDPVHGLAALDSDINAVGTKVDNVESKLDLQLDGGTITTDGTEQDVYLNDAPAGPLENLVLQIDFTNQTAAENVVVRTYYRIKAGGNLILDDEVAFAGVRDPALIDVELKPNRYGIRVTLERIAGAAQNYDWNLFYRPGA